MNMKNICNFNIKSRFVYHHKQTKGGKISWIWHLCYLRS